MLGLYYVYIIIVIIMLSFVLSFRCEKISHRIFQEFFSILRLCTDLVITFVLECAHYLAFHILRKLCCGLLFIFLSALAAPGLTDCYNTVMWPVALFCLQVCRAGRLRVWSVWDGELDDV